MRKPNRFSVTKTPCSCGCLKHGARDPLLPIRFDAKLNEYSFEHSLGRNKTISMIIYHCPMCGGVASESRRSELSVRVSKREVVRLTAMPQGLKTVESIDNALGKADHVRRYRPISGFHPILRPSGSRETKSVRVLDFTRLSDTANVQFEVFSNGEVRRTIHPKSRDASLATRRSSAKRRRRSDRV